MSDAQQSVSYVRFSNRHRRSTPKPVLAIAGRQGESGYLSVWAVGELNHLPDVASLSSRIGGKQCRTSNQPGCERHSTQARTGDIELGRQDGCVHWWLTPRARLRQIFSCLSATGRGPMVTRLRFLASALLAVLVSALHAQIQKPEVLWQFEAGG
jgi:hypothetical protein